MSAVAPVRDDIHPLREITVKPKPQRELTADRRPKRRLIPFTNSNRTLKHLHRLCERWAQQSGSVSTLEAIDMFAETFEPLSYPISVALDDAYVRLRDKGQTISEAFGAHAKVFTPELVQCLIIAEATGSYDKQLARLAKYFDREHRAAQGMKKMMIYPIALLCAMAVVVYVIVFKLVPMLIEMVNSFPGVALPWPTRTVVAAYDYAMSWVGLVAVIALSAAIALHVFLYLTNINYRYAMSQLALKVPVFGTFIRYRNLARAFSNMGLIVASTGDLVFGLRSGARTMPNLVLRDAFLHAALQVETRGRACNESLAETGALPPDAKMALDTAERNGDYGEPIERLADDYGNEAEYLRDQVLEVMQNLLLFIFGAAIGFLVISFYWPLFSMLDHIR